MPPRAPCATGPGIQGEIQVAPTPPAVHGPLIDESRRQASSSSSQGPPRSHLRGWRSYVLQAGCALSALAPGVLAASPLRSRGSAE